MARAGGWIKSTGATVLGQATSGGDSVTLLRVTEAGLKLLSLQGSGAVTVKVSVAGDIDRDGDSAAWEAAKSDLNGDGSDAEAQDPFIVEPDVYPGTLTLLPDGTRQLKVHRIDTDTGNTLDIHAARPDALSGTRYISSDESVATVSADGLITALREGQVTISVVHLGSQRQAVYDADGNYLGAVLVSQAVGQSDILLTVQAAQVTDNDDATAAPRSVQVDRTVGAAVSSATGETVLIGAGALMRDAAVAIERISVADVQARTGLRAPAAGVLEAVGAFHLELGDAATAVPVQLAIPLQAGTEVQVGDEVLFFRKGRVITPEGSWKDTWWLVDNGFVGADGVARTASPPYPGVDSSGEYVVCKRLPDVIGSLFDLGIGAGEWGTFGEFCIGGGSTGINITSEVIGILVTLATPMTAASYHFGVPQFADIALPQVAPDGRYHVDIHQVLPQAATPWGNVVLPNITAAQVDTDTRTLKFTLANSDPGDFAGTIVVRALFADGTHADVKTVPGATSGVISVDPNEQTYLDADGVHRNLAVGSVRWQLVRLVPADVLMGSGQLSGSAPLEFAGSTARVAPEADMAAVLTRTGITFVRQDTTLGQTALVDVLEGNGNNFNNTDLTGNKVQPIAFSADLSRAYVGGNGVIYVIDTVTFKLVDKIVVPAGKNITSLATTGNLLIIGEGSSFGSGAGGNRLMLMNCQPGSASYNKIVTIKGSGVEASTFGVAGMTVGPDGRTLVVAVPTQRNGVGLGDPSRRGDILIFDLATLNYKNGVVDAPIRAAMPGDGIGGKAPQVITATDDADRYLVANVADYNRGLSTLVITRNGTGGIASARMDAIRMFQPSDSVVIDRLDIQRAQSAVLVEQDGVEYAIVADDNYSFLDPYWKAMYEAPMFEQLTPFGPPTPIGGSASAKKVAVGGKLGIVKDPFGKLGAPEFIGATLPLDGYGIVNLSLSEDGSVLIGQLKGGYSADILSVQANTQKPNQSHAWNVQALITAALAQASQDRLSKHIKLPDLAEQLLPSAANGTYVGAPAGTAFDPDYVEVAQSGNMGDVIEVDLMDLIARKLLDIPGRDTAAWQNMDVSQQRAALTSILQKEQELKNFFFAAGTDFANMTDPARLRNNPDGMQLLTHGADQGSSPIAAPLIISRDSNGNATTNYWERGVFYLAPNLTDADVALLRAGGRISSAKQAYLIFDYQEKQADGSWVWKQGTVLVTANDYAATGSEVFFGDRPLDNPGYSQMTLSGSVGIGQTNDKLDVFKVEQRLRYLGFPAMGQDRATTVRTPQEFTVDGTWSGSEAKAAWLFARVVNYGKPGSISNASGTANSRVLVSANRSPSSAFSGAVYSTQLEAASSALVVSSAAPGNVLGWLNAWNAPHWVNVGTFLQQNPRWINTQDQVTGNGRWENWGTSWLGDWLVAQQFSGFQTRLNLLFNGATDANHAYTPSEHGSHDVGMAFDLGAKGRVVNNRQKAGPIDDAITDETTNGSAWRMSQLSNPAGFMQGWSDANAAWFVQPDTANTAVRNGNTADADGSYRLAEGTWAGGRENDQRAMTANILAMYSLTNPDSSSFQAARQHFTGTAAQQQAKAGALLGSLFNRVFIGGQPTTKIVNGQPQTTYHNEFADIGTVLGRLGVTSSNLFSHENHAHFTMSVPILLPIEGPPHNLLAEGDAAMPIDENHALSSAVQLAQVAEPAAIYSSPPADWMRGDKWLLDTFGRHISAAPPLSVRADGYRYAPHGPLSMPTLKFKVPVELRIRRGDDGVWRAESEGIGLAQQSCMYLDVEEGRAGAWGPECKISRIITMPKGQLVPWNDERARPGDYRYTPKRAGTDTVRFILENGEGKKVDVTVTLSITRTDPEEGGALELDTDAGTLAMADVFDQAQASAWWRGAALSELLANDSQSLIGYSNLAGSAVTSTVGEGFGARITFDENAAGHGWFIDSTPLDNSEFLPTADPNIFKAKAGSAAEGKMDMLSVLLHEYGHALGLEHSSDLHDFMAASLQPGERRLPSADELTLMARLVAELRAAETGQDQPGQPSGPNPSDPVLPNGSRAASGSRLGRRTSGTSGGNFQGAVNTTLTNGDFGADATTGWVAEGNTALGADSVTLGESATRQTHLGQGFMVNPGDRLLSFTVDASTLARNAGGPGGAFEAALLDANTGLPVAGTTALSRSDALLNIQSNLTGQMSERLAPGVRKLLNADGSTTYDVDLPAAIAGTPVMLPFDVLGFGAATSHGDRSDVERLCCKAPQARLLVRHPPGTNQRLDLREVIGQLRPYGEHPTRMLYAMPPGG